MSWVLLYLPSVVSNNILLLCLIVGAVCDGETLKHPFDELHSCWQELEEEIIEIEGVSWCVDDNEWCPLPTIKAPGCSLDNCHPQSLKGRHIVLGRKV